MIIDRCKRFEVSWNLARSEGLSCLRVLAHRLPHLFCGLVFIALLFGRGPVLRTCNRVMAHWPTGSTQTDRIRLPYTAPEASRRAFFVKEQ